MPQAVESIASVVEQLGERLEALERRIAELETQEKRAETDRQSNQPSLIQPDSPEIQLQRPRPPATWRGFPPVETSSAAVPIIGRAVLGISGAYLLRAIAEWGAISKFLVVLVALLYAGAWMVWAVRTYAGNRFAGITYALTSALIISPLLWESTVRFQVLSPASAAGVLVCFVVLAFALSWRQSLQAISGIATLAALVTAWTLIIATRELVPLTIALLTVALATEMVACLGRRFDLRFLPAVSADFAVWLTIDVMTSSHGVPEGYHSAARVTLIMLSLGLLVIYGGSIGISAFALRRRLSFFEIGQAMLSFVLSIFGILRVSNGSSATAVGLAALLLAVVCYWGALSRFADETSARNRRVSATWAAALFVGGSFLLFSASLQVPLQSLAAVVAAFLYVRTRKFSLGLHTPVYLGTAVVASSLPLYAANALAGTVPGPPDAAVWIVAASAALCYGIGSRGLEDRRRRRLLWMIPAAVVGFTAAALLVAAIVRLAGGYVELSASRLSVVRTIVNCCLALTLGFLSSRWNRIELSWVAYAAVAFGTVKLLFEDLRFGNAASLVVSLLFYGLILILLPRLTRLVQS